MCCSSCWYLLLLLPYLLPLLPPLLLPLPQSLYWATVEGLKGDATAAPVLRRRSIYSLLLLLRLQLQLPVLHHCSLQRCLAAALPLLGAALLPSCSVAAAAPLLRHTRASPSGLVVPFSCSCCGCLDATAPVQLLSQLPLIKKRRTPRCSWMPLPL